MAKLTPGIADSGAEFGNAVSIEGDTLVVGAPLDDDLGPNSGSAFVFERSGGTWTETAKLVASDGIPSARFGSALAVDGTDIIVGASRHDIGPGGTAYVFIKSGGTWVETQKLTPNYPMGSGIFGSSVDIDGETLIVGDRWDDEADNQAGAAYFFDRIGGTWILSQKILGSGILNDFGGSVAIDQNTALVSAPMRSEVHVYTRGGGGWSLQQELFPSDPLTGGRFGISTDLKGDMAVIAQVDYESNPITLADNAFAYVFLRDEVNWTQRERLDVGSELTLHAGTTGDSKEFVALSGCGVLVGTDRDDEVFSDAGAAHSYLLDSCPCEIAPGDMVSWWPLDESAARQLRRRDERPRWNLDRSPEFGYGNCGSCPPFRGSRERGGSPPSLGFQIRNHTQFFFRRLDPPHQAVILRAYSGETGTRNPPGFWSLVLRWTPLGTAQR